MSSFFQRWAHSTVPIEKGWGPCYRKGAYKTREVAEQYKTKSEESRPGLKLYIYECNVCRKFHLTKQKQREDMLRERKPNE